MPRRQRSHVRTPAIIDGRRLAREFAIRLGERVRAARLRRGWSQAELGRRVGLTGARIGQIELGRGAGASLEIWFAVAGALQTFLRLDFGRDPIEEPPDAGHLAMQELMLRLARETGRQRTFELPTKPAEPSLSVDVGWRDDRARVLILNECWNTFGSINAAVRSTRRKVAEAEALAATIGGAGTPPYRVAAVWVVRDTRRNREILARYPEVFAETFTGSSRAWVGALTDANATTPAELGLVWADRSCQRLFAWRGQQRPAPSD